MKQTYISFLQEPEWRLFQVALSHETLLKSGKNWSYTAIIEHGKFSNRLYCPLGPIATDLDALSEALDDLRAEAKARRLDFVRVEPTLDGLTSNDLLNLGLKHAHRDVQPPHTVMNDVSVSEEEIKKELSQTARRYARKCDKAGITYSVSYDPLDIRDYLPMIHEVSERTGMRPHDDLYFQQFAASLFKNKSGGLLFAELAGKRIAAIIFVKTKDTMSYVHAANLTEYRKYSPATGLGLFALIFAHQQRCKWFDWCGVAPATDDGNPRWRTWKGFTQFKLSFGGQRVDRVGTWELPIRKNRYRLYRLLLKTTKR